MKKFLHKCLVGAAIMLSSLVVLSVAPVMAAGNNDGGLQSAKEKEVKNANKWVTNKKGFYSYYNEKGEKVKGLVTIGKRRYYFDNQGIQRNGWQKLGKAYCYFRISNGTKAYMVKDTTINDIKLDKNGKAVLEDTASKEKVKVLYNAQLWARKIVTDNTLPRIEKVKALYDWTQSNSNIRKMNIGGFQKSKKDWDVYYAGLVLNSSFYPARGDCYTYASTFGYLANAVGCKVTVCSSGGHGFTLINKKFYDPSWQKTTTKRSYFGCGWDAVASGLGLRYRTHMKYTRVI